MNILDDKQKRYDLRTKRYYTDKLGQEHVVFDYSKVKMQKVQDFAMQRKIGEHIIDLPKPPSQQKIDNWNLPVDEQRFQRNTPPNNFEKLPRESRLEYMRTELSRRLNGYWFYNNGQIEYITGVHYFYLTHWKIYTGGYPAFRDSDRDIFYLWRHVEHNPELHGLVYITCRRSGKTWISSVIMYEYVSRTEDCIGGIQSKTGDDAKKVLRKLVSAWKKIPSWNKPTDSGDTNPQNELKFEEPSKRSSKGDAKQYKKVLNSSILFGASTEEFFDGFKLGRYICDEFGKSNKIDIWRRWLIVKECLNIGSRIIGKSIFTTTVEELDKGGSAAKKIWSTSDIRKAKADGRTESGMIRIFKPAYYGLEGFIDAYGYSVIDDPSIPIVNYEGQVLVRGAKTYLMNRRKGMEVDQLSSEKRKYPFSINEAFTANSIDNVLPVAKVQQQLDYNDKQPQLPLIRGNFQWKGGERDTEVEFIPNDKGRWLISSFPDKDRRNSFEIRNGIRKPKNDLEFASGCDPFDHSHVADNRRSDAASYVMKKLDPMNPTISNFFCCEYVYRTKTSSMFYEDMIMQSVFFSCQILIENNKVGCINYFKMRGYQGYLSKRPAVTMTKHSKGQQEYGIPLSGSVARETLIEFLANYLQNWCGALNPENTGINEEVMSNNYFETMLQQCINFDIEKWTKYDCVVAAGLCVLASRRKATKKVDDSSLNVSNYFEQYKIVGNKSIKI